ncbi:hypothetical protein [Geomicrobium sp. JCM 19037]|uniref:hypothetical protein n=1 Tax=Geomicrobium sp. JCM 19037 TaxID=1460634 RepID=UPI00187C8EB8|nr:hypothetical protein [Geomicrobium sp. JCM 19037]
MMKWLGMSERQAIRLMSQYVQLLQRLHGQKPNDTLLPTLELSFPKSADEHIAKIDKYTLDCLLLLRKPFESPALVE